MKKNLAQENSRKSNRYQMLRIYASCQLEAGEGTGHLSNGVEG